MLPHQFTVIEPEFLNTSIGNHKASLIPMKGKKHGSFTTEIFWYDEENKRSYTVNIDKNLNDPEEKTEIKALMDELSKKFGGQN